MSNPFTSPVMERCANCRSICLCKDACVCMTDTSMLINECGCVAPDSLLDGQRCDHLLCHTCADAQMDGSLEWDGAPRE